MKIISHSLVIDQTTFVLFNFLKQNLSVSAVSDLMEVTCTSPTSIAICYPPITRHLIFLCTQFTPILNGEISDIPWRLTSKK